jgi:2-hydroxychromene-2-carboxylate isomerase
MNIDLKGQPPGAEEIAGERTRVKADIRRVRRTDNLVTAFVILSVSLLVGLAVYWTTRDLRYAGMAAAIFPLIGACLSVFGLITAAGFRSAAKRMIELDHQLIALNGISEASGGDVERLCAKYPPVARYVARVRESGREVTNGELATFWELDSSTAGRHMKGWESRDPNAAEPDPTIVKTVEWYFDFLSPFAYLQFQQFRRLPRNVRVVCKPILLAGLLKHWESKGPAELPTKRAFTYRHVTWLGRRHGIPLRMPPAHPFPPLKPLRLALALKCDTDAIGEIFNFIWAEGRSPDEPAEFKALAKRLAVENADEIVGRQEVKDQLRLNTEEAISRGVFGVPTACVDGELFWGFDATDMLVEYLHNPAMLKEPEMQRVTSLPMGVQRS